MSSNPNTKSSKLSSAMHLIAGTQKHFPNASQELTFGGASRTVSAATALLQSYVDLRNATLASQAAARAKLAAEKEQGPPLFAFLREYAVFVKSTFGNQPDILADFGLTPPKAAAPKSTVEKATAAAKRAATRQARHTMGSNQKKGVKGDVTAVVVTPVKSAPVTPPPTPAPAPAGTSGGSPASTTHAT